METNETKGLKGPTVLVCGASPTAFLLVGLLRSKGCVVNVYTRDARWAENLPVRVFIDGLQTASGRASLVSSDPSMVCRGINMVILASPPSTHEQVLSEIIPYIPAQKAWVVAIEGGWWQPPANLHSGTAFVFLPSTPWICTTKGGYSRSLQQLDALTAGLPVPKLLDDSSGQTKTVAVTVVASRTPLPLGVVAPRLFPKLGPVIRDTLSNLFDVKFELADLLACALDPYCVFGPALVHSALKSWNGIAFAEPPSLEELGALDVPFINRLEEMGDEMYNVQNRIQLACGPAVGYVPSKPLLLRIRDSPDVVDKSSLRSCVFTHRSLAKLTLPCDRIADVAGQAVYLPQCVGQRDASIPQLREAEDEATFLNLREDVPYGLLFAFAIGQKLDPPVSMPRCQEVLEWSQRQLRKDYIGVRMGQGVTELMRGKDMASTRCPAPSMDLESFLHTAVKAGGVRVHNTRRVPLSSSAGLGLGISMPNCWPEEAPNVEFKGSLYATMLMLLVAMSWTVCAGCSIIASWHGISVVEVILLDNAIAWLINSFFIRTQHDSTLYRMKLWDIIQAATTVIYTFLWMWSLEYMSLANVATLLLGSPVVASVMSAIKRHRHAHPEEANHDWFSLLSWRLWGCVALLLGGTICLSIEEEQEGVYAAIIGVVLCSAAMWFAGSAYYFIKMHSRAEADLVLIGPVVPSAVRANGEFVVAMVVSGLAVLFSGSLSLPVMPATWMSLLVGGASLFVGGVALAKCAELSGLELSSPSPLYLMPPVANYNALTTGCFAVLLSLIFTYTAFSPHHHFGLHDAWGLVAVVLILIPTVSVVHQEMKLVEEAQTDIPDVPYDFPASKTDSDRMLDDSDDESNEYYDNSPPL